MILVKKWKIPLCLFQDRIGLGIGLGIMFDDHLVKKSFLDYKDIPFYIVAILDSFKGFTDTFGPKLEIFHLFAFGHIRPRNNV